MALDHRLSAEADHHERIAALGDALDRDVAIERIECFDVSHLAGESTVASCVVFDRSGPRKSDYHKFNINQARAGDDYAAMHEALNRRYSRLKREEGAMPDLILIDGGKGQVAQALAVLDELQIDDVLIVGIAKGVTRKPGFEKLVLHDGLREYRLASDSPALHLLQHVGGRVRDVVHRVGQQAVEQVGVAAVEDAHTCAQGHGYQHVPGRLLCDQA